MLLRSYPSLVAAVRMHVFFFSLAVHTHVSPAKTPGKKYVCSSVIGCSRHLFLVGTFWLTS